MQSLITELDALVSKTDSKTSNLALPKIIESTCNLINYLSNCSKSEVTQHVKALHHVLNSILSIHFGESMNEYLIARIISSLFIKVMAACESSQNQVLLTNIFNILLSSKTKLSIKVITIATLNGILKNNKEIVNFPRGILQDMFQNLLKTCKGVHEISIRLGAINCMRLLIKMKLALSTTNTQEIMKLLLRYIAEKTEELKLCCARTLLSFLNHSPWSDALAFYEQIYTLCIKTIADNVMPDLKRQLTLCFAKINIMKLEKGLEVKKHGKTAPSQAESSDKDRVAELIHSFNVLYLKEEGIRYFLLEYLYLALIYFKKDIRVTHLNTLLNSLWNLFKKISPDYAPKHEKFCSKFMQGFTLLLSQELKFSFFSVVVETLKLKASSKVPEQEDSLKANAILIKNNPVRAGQFQYLLKLFIHIMESLGSLFAQKSQSPNQLFDVLIPYLSYDNTEIQICASYALNFVVEAFTKVRPHIISRLRNSMTLARGELAATQIDVNKKDPFGEPTYHLNTVRGCSFTLALLVQNVDFETKSIPFDIINLVFENAKSILTDDIEDPHLKKILYDNAEYPGLGWTMIGELTSLEYHWVGSRIKTLFDLWKNLLMVDEIPANSEVEFKKRLLEMLYAFKALRKFSGNCRKLQNEPILKVIGTFVCNFTSIVLSQFPKTSFQGLKKTDNEILSAKMEIYRCVNLINPMFYATKFNLILQTAIEDVANFLNEEIYFITKKLFPYMEYDIAYLLDFGPKFFKVLYGLEDIYDFEEKENTIFDYDFSEQFYSKNLTNTKSALVKEQLSFIGEAFASQIFTHKNKMQLLRFLASNVKACHAAKDPFLRIQKLFSLLIITLSIVHKIYQELPKGEEIDRDMLDIFKEICECSWTYVNNHARVTCALIYAMLFKLSKSAEFQETLLKNLYDGLSDPIKSPTISVVVGCIFKLHPQMDQNLFVQLVNIFQKSSRNHDGTNAIWLINSLRLGLEHSPDYSDHLIKACLPFLMRYHYENKTSGRVSFIAWCHLLEVLTKRMNLLNIGRMYHIDALVLDLDNTDFVIPDVFMKNAKLTLTAAILSNQQLNSQIKYKYTKYLVKVLRNPRRAGKTPKLPEKAFDLTHDIVEKGDLEQINLFEMKFNQIYLDNINSQCNQRHSKVEKIDKIYHKFLSVQLQLLKLKLSSFEDQLLFFKDYVFPEQEHMAANGEGGQPEKPSAGLSSGKIEFNKEYSITLRTRIYALKCIENLLQYTNVQMFKAKDVISFASLIIPFVFKVASLPFEEAKEIGMRIFHSIFSKLINYSETGEHLETMTEGEKTPLMLQYGAQIDALIRINLKDINENSAASVQSSLRLYHKLFKLMYKEDITMVKRLFTLVAVGVQGPLKLPVSTYHSEKTFTEIHFTRVRILCKIYQFFKDNLQTETVLQEEFEHFFPEPLKKYLEQHLVAILEDSALVAMFTRKTLKNYDKFHFIYNGTKISYDSKAIFTNLPVFLLTYFSLLIENSNLEKIIGSIGEEETKKHLRNNAKSIPQREHSIHVCLILCNFFLTHNDVYENKSEGSQKHSKKLYDYQVYKTFNEKVMVLKALQTILLEDNIVEENLEVFTESLHLFNNYLKLGNPVITKEIFKVYQVVIERHLTIETFEIICTSLSLFINAFQQEVWANPDVWLETLGLFFVVMRLLMTKLVKFVDEFHREKKPSLGYLLYFLNLMLSFLFSGVPRLQLEGSRALKQAFQALVEVSRESENKRALVIACFEKFISVGNCKLSQGEIPQEIKIRLLDLLLHMEQTIKNEGWKQVEALLEESTFVICQDSNLVRVYILNLRTVWRNTKQVTIDLLPKIMLFVKCSFEQMQIRKTLTSQDNELIAEIFKMFVYLQFECPTVNKLAFPESLLSFVLLTVDLKAHESVIAVVVQLMQHLYSNIPAANVKQMLNNLTEEQRRVLCQMIPILQTVNEQKIDAQQANANANIGQAQTEKPVIKLKTFGKK